MRLYLEYNAPETRDAIHGVDYTNGIPEGETCGKKHQFVTRNCRPVVFSQADKDSYPSGDFVELVYFRGMSLNLEGVLNEDSPSN